MIDVDDLRRERNIRLAETDWTQAAGSALSPRRLAAFEAQRSALRDLPSTTDLSAFDEDRDWPRADFLSATLPLDTVRRFAVACVNDTIGRVRSGSITVPPGQERFDIAKEAEATRCLADAAPTPVGYPLLAAELGITGQTLAEVATVVTSTADFWRRKAAALEKLRSQTNRQIEVATTRVAIVNALDALDTALESLPP